MMQQPTTLMPRLKLAQTLKSGDRLLVGSDSVTDEIIDDVIIGGGVVAVFSGGDTIPFEFDEDELVKVGVMR